ncbi:MAG TPA: hypothetical protein VNK46_00310 [Nitrospiraceae bacterium]|nr:hypothetical protein [Nitrospiraceae bacterium]
MGCVAGWNFDHRYPSSFGLVSDEVTELSKGPHVDHCPTFLPGLHLHASTEPDAGEILKCDGVVPLTGFLDNLLGDDMVQVSHSSGFFPGQPFQGPFCGPCAPPLKSSPKRESLFSFVEAFPSSIELAGTRNRDVIDTSVNTDDTESPLVGRENVGLFLDHDMNEPSLLLVHDDPSAGRFLSMKSLSLIVTKSKGNTKSSFDRGNGNLFVPFSPLEDSLIVVDGCQFEGLDFSAMSRRASFRRACPSNSTNGEVGGETGFLPDFTVAEVLDLDFVGRFGFGSRLESDETGFREGFGRSLQGPGLFRRRSHLALDGSFHDDITVDMSRFVKSRRFLPALKCVASAPGIL